MVSSIANIRIGVGNYPAWLQASLPVRFGGLGFRSAVQLAPSAFLASAAASSNLVSQILPARLQSLPAPYLDVALSRWSHGHDISPPSGSTQKAWDDTIACIQKAWDDTIVSTAASGSTACIQKAWDDTIVSTAASGSTACIQKAWDDTIVSTAASGSTACIQKAWDDTIVSTAASGSTACIQKAWDDTIVSTAAKSLSENAPDDLAQARLLASSSKVSGARLHALPISSLGLRMDDNTIRVAVGLRLGSTLCRPHSYQHCGAKVDHLTTHMYSLSCKKSEGRH